MEQTGAVSAETVKNASSPEEDTTHCIICLEDHPLENIVQFENCIHSLCRECYRHFQETSNRCPICRTAIENEDVITKRLLSSIRTKLSSLTRDLQKLKTLDFQPPVNTRNGDVVHPDPESEQQFENAEPTVQTEDTDENVQMKRDLEAIQSSLKNLLTSSIETGLMPMFEIITSQVPVNGGPPPINFDIELPPDFGNAFPRLAELIGEIRREPANVPEQRRVLPVVLERRTFHAGAGRLPTMTSSSNITNRRMSGDPPVVSSNHGNFISNLASLLSRIANNI